MGPTEPTPGAPEADFEGSATVARPLDATGVCPDADANGARPDADATSGFGVDREPPSTRRRDRSPRERVGVG